MYKFYYKVFTLHPGWKIWSVLNDRKLKLFLFDFTSYFYSIYMGNLIEFFPDYSLLRLFSDLFSIVFSLVLVACKSKSDLFL